MVRRRMREAAACDHTIAVPHRAVTRCAIDIKAFPAALKQLTRDGQGIGVRARMRLPAKIRLGFAFGPNWQDRPHLLWDRTLTEPPAGAPGYGPTRALDDATRDDPRRLPIGQQPQ